MVHGRSEGPEWGPPGHGQHYVVEVDGEALDITTRQFRVEAPFPLREPLSLSHGRWGWANLVDPDNPWTQRSTDNITPRWAELPDVAPPGDELGWPVPLASRQDAPSSFSGGVLLPSDSCG